VIAYEHARDDVRIVELGDGQPSGHTPESGRGRQALQQTCRTAL
jgi:hypothetical protein